MTLTEPVRSIGVEEYLRGELLSDIRHEYLGGQVYAMAGADERHNRIALNIAFQLRAVARGTACGVFISDMKLRVAARDAFYYPDVLLICDPGDDEPFFKSRPCLIVEVLSPSTEVIDRREKLIAYRALPSLRYYLLVARDTRRVEFYQADEDGWRHQILDGTGSLRIDCGELFSATLTLADIYEDVNIS